MNRIATLGAVAVTGLAAAIGMGLFLPNLSRSPSQLYAQQTIEAQQALQSADHPAVEHLSQAFKAAAKMLRPSVVRITAQVDRRVLSRRGSGSFGFPEEFRGLLPEEFFRDLPDQRFPRRGQRQPEPSDEKIDAGVGSGVIVTPNGYILTNNHVIEDADALVVLLSDGRKFPAKVVGTDQKSDVAVLKIEASGLVAARIGDSSNIEVGDWVIAVGSPFELDQTVTAGIISATHRTGIGILASRGGYEDFLQTDAAINPGNSGGPLVNLRGEVIGINTAINSSSGSNAGVGFAIPSNMANDVMQSILKHGRVVRSYIGATLAELSEKVIAEQKLPLNFQSGVLVESVLKESPASKAGIRPGDIVASIDGQDVRSVSELRNRISMKTPGKALQLKIFRDGREQTITVTPEEYSEEKLAQMNNEGSVKGLGISVASMTPEIAKEVGLEEDLKGAIITEIDRRSTAARALRVGDVITEVNGKAIDDAAGFIAATQNARGLRMIVRRGESEIMIRIN